MASDASSSKPGIHRNLIGKKEETAAFTKKRDESQTTMLQMDGLPHIYSSNSSGECHSRGSMHEFALVSYDGRRPVKGEDRGFEEESKWRR